MDFKYANLLTVLFVTMMFGSGIPILYLVSALYFLFTYWTDKILIFFLRLRWVILDNHTATAWKINKARALTCFANLVLLKG